VLLLCGNGIEWRSIASDNSHKKCLKKDKAKKKPIETLDHGMRELAQPVSISSDPLIN